jgi:hypothetical protein
MKKVQLSLCLINKAPNHEEIWGSGGMAPPFLTSALDGGGQLHAVAALTPELNNTPGIFERLQLHFHAEMNCHLEGLLHQSRKKGLLIDFCLFYFCTQPGIA